MGAEPWTDAIRADVEAGLGVKATNIYGLSEIIGPGVSNEDVNEQSGSYIWEDHFYPEILDPETLEPLPEGADGVLVITTLTKEALPLLRYWTGDITSLRREIGASGRTHARMGMIKGRSDDMIIVRGVNLYPTQIEAVLQSVSEVAMHYQIALSRQGTLDTCELRPKLAQDTFYHMKQKGGQEVLSEEFVETDQYLRALRNKVQHKIKDTVGVNVKVDLLAPRSAGGKLRRIVDERNL